MISEALWSADVMVLKPLMLAIFQSDAKLEIEGGLRYSVAGAAMQAATCAVSAPTSQFVNQSSRGLKL